MFRKRLGFVPLIWKCPFCGTENPGPIKSCTNCGAPQPDDVEFLQVDEEKFSFIKDEALIRMAKAGPDIHCPFCGTRNAATNEICTKCGGDLNWDGKERQTGQRVRTVSEAKEKRPSTDEPAKKMGKGGIIAISLILLGLIVGCVVLMVMLFKTDDITATVTDVEWERSITIEAYTQVRDKDWRDQIPAGAQVGTCTMMYRYTSDTPKQNATEVCGDPYVEDTGTGVGEVVQDCSFEVYDDYCEYTMMAWVVADSISDSGHNHSPVWPALNLQSGEREGERQEKYFVYFNDGSVTYTYSTSNEQLFSQALIGSKWTLSINQLGGVQSIEPAN